VRIDCSLCGVEMLDLHLCLSASVNVRYISHTQTLRFIYNKILVRVSLCPFLSLSILNYLPHLQHLLVPLHVMLSPSPAFLFPISSTPTLLMAKDEICNIDGNGNNNAMNLPPFD
jgi:hypothetical protein